MYKFFAILFVFLSVSLIAQDTVKVKPVFVTATSPDPNVLTFSEETIENEKNIALSDFLSQYSNLPIKKYSPAGLATVSIRGMQTSHTRLFWNDVPLTSSMSGQSDLSLIPLFAVGKISVNKGISGLQQTNGAFGGVINLQSPDSESNSVKFYSSASSLLNFSEGITLATNIKKSKLFTAFYTGFGKNKFSFKNTALPEMPVDTVTDADFRFFGFTATYIFDIGKTKIKFFALGQKNFTNYPPLMSFQGLARIENQTTNRFIAGLNLKNKKIKTTVWFSHTQMNYFLADSVRNFPKNQIFIKNASKNIENSAGLLFKYKFFDNKKLKIFLSEKFVFNSVSSCDTALDNTPGYATSEIRNFTSIIFFYKIGNSSTFNVLVNETYGNSKFYSSSFLLSYERFRKVLFKINLGRNLRLPTLNDLYWQPGGNPYLKPEVAWSVDLSFSEKKDFHNLKIDFKNVVFYSFIQGLILWKPTEFYYWRPVNIQTVNSYGDEVSFGLEYDKKISHRLTANFSYIRSINLSKINENDNSYGKQLIYIPQLTGNFIYELAWNKYKFTTDFIYIGRRTTNTANPDLFTLPPYCLVSSGLSVNFNIVNLSFKIGNLFNHRYQTVLYKALPGREFMLNVVFRLYRTK